MKIQFIDVGRDKWNGIKEFPDTEPAMIETYAYNEAKRHLASRFPEVEYDKDANEGMIFAGDRVVGAFKVIK